MRFNDVIADPEGRVFCRTMPGDDSLGDPYRFDVDATVTTVVDDGFSAASDVFWRLLVR